jgi:hypothetical protein
MLNMETLSILESNNVTEDQGRGGKNLNLNLNMKSINARRCGNVAVRRRFEPASLLISPGICQLRWLPRACISHQWSSCTLLSKPNK